MTAEKTLPARAVDTPPPASDNRLEAARAAMFQIESTADAMLTIIEKEPRDPTAHAQALISLTVRMKELNSVVMSVLCDDNGRPTHEMERVVFGEALSTSAMDEDLRATPGTAASSMELPPKPDFTIERVRQEFDERMDDLSVLIEQADAVAVLISEAPIEVSISRSAQVIMRLLDSAQSTFTAAIQASRAIEAAGGRE